MTACRWGVWFVLVLGSACGDPGKEQSTGVSGSDSPGAGGGSTSQGDTGGSGSGGSSASTGSGAGTSTANGGSNANGSSAGGETASGNGLSTASGTGGSGGDGGSGTLSERYPGDVGIVEDESVLFHDDFEQGWGRWSSPEQDTEHLFMEQDPGQAQSGSGYLRSTVTTAQLEQDEYISSASRFDFDTRVPEMYWRFYAWFADVAPNPHHWVRVAAGTEAWDSSGLANTVPAGDDGFWFDLDASNDDVFNFYVYWYLMRSGRCNDGTAVEGCEGDQGTTYYYGNVFLPEPQNSFERDAWTCVEIGAKANSVGDSDGELALWVNDELVGRYRPGEPTGTWLRAQFHTGGCDFSACSEPTPFEGFDFRSSDDVLFKSIILDAYYERGSSADKKAELESRGLTVSDTQTILYDDIVVATERIGCRVAE